MSQDSYKIVLMPGDGVGPDVLTEAEATLETAASLAGFSVQFERVAIGGAAIDAYGVPVRDEDIATARAADATMLGAVGGPKWDSVEPEIRPERGLLKLRQELELFANLRPVRVFDALVDASPLKPEIARGADLLIVRELTGGIYFGQPSEQRTTDAGREAVDTLPYQEREIERLVRLGFELAKGRRQKVTSVDKSNVMSTSRLWREIATEVGADYPEITLEHALVDACAMQLISRPGSFDVMVMENMFGDILSDEAAVLAGSLGMLPSASLGTATNQHGGQFGMYEPIHGSAPDIADQGIANPTGAILSAASLLRLSLKRDAEAELIEKAVETVLNDGARTADIAGDATPASTAEFGHLVREAMRDHYTDGNESPR